MEKPLRLTESLSWTTARIVMDGQPREIFSRVKELKSHGLDVPQVTELAWELKEQECPLRMESLAGKSWWNSWYPL